MLDVGLDQPGCVGGADLLERTASDVLARQPGVSSRTSQVRPIPAFSALKRFGAAGLATCGAVLSALLATPAGAQTAQTPPTAGVAGSAPDNVPTTPEDTTRNASASPITGLTTPDAKPYSRFDAWSLRPTWNIPFPEVGDSLTKDAGGFRTALADVGIGVNLINITRFTQNFTTLGTPLPQTQQYNGQGLTGLFANYLYLTGDLDKIAGLHDAKIILAFNGTATNWNQLGPDKIGLHEAYFEQKLFGDHVDVQIGYIINGTQFTGTFVGGNFEGGTLGPEAIITDEVGLSDQTANAPAMNIRVSGKRFYNKFGIQRSILPGGVVPEHAADPHGFNFRVSGASILFVDEVGYQVAPDPDHKSVWIRTGGIYNTTKYARFDGRPSNTNYGLYGLADFQLTRNTAALPYSGIYVGGTVMYAPPDVNLYSQYYEFRLYDVAPFPGRPADITTLVVTRNIFSDQARIAYAGMTVPNRHSSTSITGSYTAHIVDGLYLGGAVGYTRNPAFVVQPGDPNAVTGTVNLVFHL